MGLNDIPIGTAFFGLIKLAGLLAMLLITLSGILHVFSTLLPGTRGLANRLLVIGISIPIIATLILGWVGQLLTDTTLSSLFAPILEWFGILPWWVQLLFGGLIALGLLRLFLTPFLGSHAAGLVTGVLTVDLIRFLIRITVLPLSFIRRWLLDR